MRTCINNHIYRLLWDVITHVSLHVLQWLINSSISQLQVRAWVSNYLPLFYVNMITYPQSRLVKQAHKQTDLSVDAMYHNTKDLSIKCVTRLWPPKAWLVGLGFGGQFVPRKQMTWRLRETGHLQSIHECLGERESSHSHHYAICPMVNIALPGDDCAFIG